MQGSPDSQNELLVCVNDIEGRYNTMMRFVQDHFCLAVSARNVNNEFISVASYHVKCTRGSSTCWQQANLLVCKHIYNCLLAILLSKESDKK